LPNAGVKAVSARDGVTVPDQPGGTAHMYAPEASVEAQLAPLLPAIAAPDSATTNVTAAQSAQGYIAQAAFYQMSGSVTLNGLALSNVAMTATGGPTCSSTNSAGQYSCTVPLNWSGSVTPSATGYSFGPASRSYTSVASNQTAQTFTAALDTATAPLYFVHVDHLNTPRLVTNDQQQAVWRWDQQEPFGANAPNENPSTLGAFEFPLRFPGQYADKETHLYYNYHRDYDALLGRYIESDPIGLLGGLNTYAYVGSDPLLRFDRRGLSFDKEFPDPLALLNDLAGHHAM
jgi:RHS repeat-associated protein